MHQPLYRCTPTCTGLLAPLQLSYITIVCYGIGHIGTCHIAQHQFALLLELKDLYKPRTTWLYDPVLHEEEKAVTSQCGCRTITVNQVSPSPSSSSMRLYRCLPPALQISRRRQDPVFHATLWQSNVQQSAVGKLEPTTTIKDHHHRQQLQQLSRKVHNAISHTQSNAH